MFDDHPEYVLCRTFGHTWDPLDDIDITEAVLPVWQHVFVLRCTRCTMRRIDGINVYGEVGSRRYEMPIGYQLTKHDTKPSKAEYRLMAATDVLPRRKRQG